MFVGTLRVELFIPASHSLKARRSVLNSLKERVKSRFNASVAEVDGEDLWQRATLGVAVVSGDHGHLLEVLDAILRVLESDPRAQVLDTTREIR
jgi:uncharacterized protein YlxP (DUF503 family)